MIAFEILAKEIEELISVIFHLKKKTRDVYVKSKSGLMVT